MNFSSIALSICEGMQPVLTGAVFNLTVTAGRAEVKKEGKLSFCAGLP